MNRKQIVSSIWTTVTVGLATVRAMSGSTAVDPVSNWNTVAVQATLTSGENAVVQSRTLAIVHVAVHDALNAIHPRYERYAFTGIAGSAASADAAISAAARNH